MAELKYTNFSGEIPIVSDRLLPLGFAKSAQNCNPETGELRGLRSPSSRGELSDPSPRGLTPKRPFKLVENDGSEQFVATATIEGEYLKSPLAGETLGRWYIFEPGLAPRVALFDDLLLLGDGDDIAFGQPTLAPTLVENPVGTPSPRLQTRVYVYTFVTTWGEESRASPSSSIIVPENGEVTVSGFHDTPSPSISGRSYDKIRIYRSVTSTEGGQLYFVDEIDYVDTSYLDQKNSLEITFGSTLSSSAYDPPPSGIYGARVHPSGAFVAFKDRDVYFSIPYKPWAWPEDWKITVADEIVGIEMVGQQVLVMTKGRPAVIYGAEPGFMGLLNFPFSQPCVAYNTIVAFPEGVYYAGRDGLVFFDGTTPYVITKDMISRTDWQNNYLYDDIVCGRSGSRYIAYSVANAAGFVMDQRGPRTSFIQISNLPCSGAFTTEMRENNLLMLDGDEVFEFDPADGFFTEYYWASGDAPLPRPVNFGSVFLQANPEGDPASNWFLAGTPWGNTDKWLDGITVNPDDTYDRRKEAIVTVVGDGTIAFQGPMTDLQEERLLSGYKAHVWYVDVTGHIPIYSVFLTETGRMQSRG